MQGIGCSIRILVIPVIILLVLFGIGFVFGPIGSSFLGIEPPSIFQVPQPHVELAPEGIFDIAGFSITNTLIASWLSIILLVVIFYICTRRMKLVPGKLQSLAEIAVELLLNFVESVAGKKYAKVVFPLVATIFIYVIANAYLALLPFFGTIGIIIGEGEYVSLFRAANTDINLCLSIAIMSFIFVEYWGVRSLGVSHYIGEFINVRQLGQGVKQLFTGKIRPAITNIAFGFINLFIGLLEIFSHLIRIVSFSFRLFGNMTAGEILLLIATFLIPLVFALPFYGLELLIGFIQALIFAGLTLVFGIIAMSPMHGETE